MAELVYTFGEIREALQTMKEKGQSFVGLDMNEKEHIARSKVEESHLNTSFTPVEVIKLTGDNSDAISVVYNKDFLHENITLLKQIQARVDTSKLEKPVTISEYNDKIQKEEYVYGFFRLNFRVLNLNLD